MISDQQQNPQLGLRKSVLLSWGKSYCSAYVAMRAEKSLLGSIVSPMGSELFCSWTRGVSLKFPCWVCPGNADFQLMSNLCWASSSLFEYLMSLTHPHAVFLVSELPYAPLQLRQLIPASYNKGLSVYLMGCEKQLDRQPLSTELQGISQTVLTLEF